MKLVDAASSGASVSLTAAGAVPSATEAIASGNSLFDAATSAADSVAGASSYSGVAAAASALASGLPPGAATTAVKQVLAVGAAAASGAALGASVAAVTGPFWIVTAPIAAEIGAVVGAGLQIAEELWPTLVRDDFSPIDIAGDLAGDVLNVVGLDEPNPPQTDFRYIAEKLCFPAVDNDYKYGVTPGQFNMNPRCSSVSDFYETDTVAKMHSMLFTFFVGYRQPPGSNLTSQSTGWTLAQYYVATDNVTSGHVAGESVRAAALWKTLTSAMGPQHAARALAKLERWYGRRSKFDTRRPFASTGCTSPNGANTVANVDAMMKEFEKRPLDYLYYPIPSRYDSGSLEFVPTSHARQGVAMLTPDTILLTLAEAAVLMRADETAFHLVLLSMHLWKKGRELDAKTYAGIDTKNHPNFARCLGLIAHALRADAPKPKPKKKAAPRAAAPSPVNAIAHATQAPAPRAPAAAAAPVVLVEKRSIVRELAEGLAVALAAGGLIALLRKKG